VLEVAIGTGLNLPFYRRRRGRDGHRSGGADAEHRPRSRRRPAPPVELRQGDAQELPFDDAAFDTVVCTFGLCAIPDLDTALDDMARVLPPGGRLILVDHVASSFWLARGVQRRWR